MIGQTLSQFKITAKLGEGGMGEVYRAEDTTLDREVAIKVLPEALTADPERLARFEREAKVLAALNHPNIAGIHQVAEADGQRFLVMELVEGEDLAERLARGAMTLEEAVPLVLQVAEGLEAAHERGIVHRDLKPANVRITPEGQVKILDFGLAKNWDGEQAGASGLSASPTLTAQMTQAGVILGTAGYMSPEQARGQEADRRSDIWSFGVLFHEMLTGSRLFTADTVSDTLARVLLAEVDWVELDSDLPRSLTELLHRCLERDPRKRLQAMGEARFQLETFLEEPQTGTGDFGRGSGGEAAAKRSSAWLPWALTAVAALVAVAAWVGFPDSAGSPVASTVAKYRVNPVGRAFDSNARSMAISPLGNRIVFEMPGKILIRELDELEPRVLVDDVSGEPAPFWSPDGGWVAYYNSGRLWKVPAGGGSPSVICSVPNNYNAAGWGAGDRVVFVLTRGDMYEVSARGGDPELLVERVEGEDIDFHTPTFLPDGATLLYAVHRPSGVDTIEILEGDRRSVVYRLEGQVRLNPQVVNDPVYSATGHILFRRDAGDRGIWALPFSLEERQATGQAFLVADEGVWPSVSADGRRMLYAEHAGTASVQLMRIGMDGSPPTVIGEPFQGIREPSISPEGRRIAFSALAGSNRELFVMDLEGRQIQVTTTPESEDSPSWTPDGSALIFQKSTGEGTGIFRMTVDGGGVPEQLVDFASDPHLSALGRYIAFCTNSREILGVGYFDLEGAEETILFESGADFADPKLSPDENVLAYSGWETSAPAVALRRFPGGTTSQMIPESGQASVAWSPDGKTLYYKSDTGTAVRAVSVDSEPSLMVGRPATVLDLETLGLAALRTSGLDVFPDGKAFLVARPLVSDERLGEIVLVENWIEEFR